MNTAQRVRFLSFPDGTIQFIKKGLPPEEVPGYEVDPGDPYMFHPILPPCAARIFKNMNHSTCCPTGQHVRHCTKYGYYMMTAELCKGCFAKGLHLPIPTPQPPTKLTDLGMDKIK